MVKRRNSSNANSKPSLRIWLVAGASSLALAAGVLAVSTRTVLADARLRLPSATAPPAVPIASATPALLAPQKPLETIHPLHGIASWYGGVFNGRLTASGERYDMNAMTACHPTLPFGSIVRVVNLANHRSVIVRINDRGYLYNGRMMDLSYGAARRLAMIQPGLARIDVQVLSLGKTGDKKTNN